MLQQTLARLDGLDCAAPIIVCNEEHRFIVAEQLRLAKVASNGIILEPNGRNTAPAIALAALHAAEIDRNSMLLVPPADHFMSQPQDFHRAIT
jgi:mannose-1-phosphate guanylyltransferase